MSPLASSPRRRFGSHDHLRSFHARLVAATAARLVRPSPSHVTARLVAAAALRLARPPPIISRSPRRRDGGSARTTLSHPCHPPPHPPAGPSARPPTPVPFRLAPTPQT